MLHTLKMLAVRIGGLVAVLALAACGSLSQVSEQGTTSDPVWPDPADVSFNNGSYPNVDSLRLVGDGMTKDQLYNLLGRPHFAEGFAGVHEWDYLFHFRTPDGVRTCQYKVLFDRDMLARSFLWRPASCADVLNAPRPAGQKSVSLNSDVLFAFDSASLTEAGRNEVARVAEQLRPEPGVAIMVTGYTDRLGPTAYNKALSQRRAEAVRNALAHEGVARDSMIAVGKGASDPVVSCDQDVEADLIGCLAPNRRVVVSTSSAH